MNREIRPIILPSKFKLKEKQIVTIIIFLTILFISSFFPLKNNHKKVKISSTPDWLTTTSQQISIASSEAKFYSVIRVVDGDTLVVDIDGKNETVRLIGINSPEVNDPRKPVECFGREASNKAKEILTGKKVRLEIDSTQGDRDKYGRLLRYVFLEDGTNFNQLMIEQGYAFEYTYHFPYRYQKEFKQAQKKAEEEGKGLWEEGRCGR
jgi:micrococcal nuclease